MSRDRRRNRTQEVVGSITISSNSTSITFRENVVCRLRHHDSPRVLLVCFLQVAYAVGLADTHNARVSVRAIEAHPVH